jgi:uncharacterized protein (TIGR00255 family)
MLLSMTGFGEARYQQDGVAIGVEIRTLNNRYLKLSVRCAEAYSSLEPQIEQVIRHVLHRGTVHVSLRVDRQPSPEDFQINTVALVSFVKQLKTLQDELGIEGEVPLGPLLAVPGVVGEGSRDGPLAIDDWPMIRPVLDQALERLQAMRADEGRSMREDLVAQCKTVETELAAIANRAPDVVTAYRDRLRERVANLLKEMDVEIDAKDLIREVSIFAERGDVAEEIVRLRSHLEQFSAALSERQSLGRKLEFLSQEMFREVNTIGSKGNDVVIAAHVVEIKGAIERIRELVQNIE